MTIEEYYKTISLYDELLKQSLGVPAFDTIMERKIEFVSMALVTPSYTMKASWFIEQGKAITLDRIMQMHPFDYCVTYASLSKDWDKALTMLNKYLHENIDMKFGKTLKP